MTADFNDVLHLNNVRFTSGVMWIPRPDKEVESYMDAHFLRQFPGELRWIAAVRGEESIHHLKDIHKGQVAYIVGKGPSLDVLVPEDFEHTGPILCVNDSVNQIGSLDFEDRPLYLVQQDRTPRCTVDNVIPIVQDTLADVFEGKRYLFKMQEITMFAPTITACIALALAKQMGCMTVRAIAFDAIEGDFRYAPSIGYPSSGPTGKRQPPERFRKHRAWIETQAKHLGLDFAFILREELKEINGNEDAISA